MSNRDATLALLWVAGGGVLGLLAAMIEETIGSFAWASILIVPPIEEMMKPIGLIFLLDKRPHWLRSSLHVVMLALLGALIFASLENGLYIFVYASKLDGGYWLFRVTVCTAVHLVATGIFGAGLAKMWQHIKEKGGHFDIDVCFNYFVAASILHGLYNLTVVILEAAGVISFQLQ